MKKFLAILLASIMVFALATPAMATVPYVGYVYIDIEGLTEGESTGAAYDNISLEVTQLSSTTTLDGAAGKDIAKSRWQVKSGSEWTDFTGSTFEGGQTYRVKLAITKEAGYNFEYALYRFRYLPDTSNPVQVTPEWGGNDFVYVYSGEMVAAENTKVESIELNLSPKVGDDVYNTTPTVVATPANSAYVYDATWGRYPIGDTFGGTSTEVLQGGATFEKGYVYVYIPYIYASSGYKLVDDSTTLIVNGDSTTYSLDGMDVSPMITFTIEDAPEEETTTTVAETTTATETTTASTAVETGDSSNMTIYVIALIALVAAAGVTIFATKKSK